MSHPWKKLGLYSENSFWLWELLLSLPTSLTTSCLGPRKGRITPAESHEESEGPGAAPAPRYQPASQRGSLTGPIPASPAPRPFFYLASVQGPSARQESTEMTEMETKFGSKVQTKLQN